MDTVTATTATIMLIITLITVPFLIDNPDKRLVYGVELIVYGALLILSSH